jgi:hypothetical protein
MHHTLHNIKPINHCTFNGATKDFSFKKSTTNSKDQMVVHDVLIDHHNNYKINHRAPRGHIQSDPKTNIALMRSYNSSILPLPGAKQQ